MPDEADDPECKKLQQTSCCIRREWRSTFYVVQATSAKCGLHAGNINFSTHN